MPPPDMSTNPVDVVCAIVRREGRILVARRPPGKRLGGLWEFPGGKVEDGEQPEAALHRELAEELGCAVAVLESGPAVGHEYEWGRIRLHPFVCELAGPDEPFAHEHTALRWVGMEELLALELELAPADVPVVKWLERML